jgi:hypothetical protein
MGMSATERENHAVEQYLRFLATGELPTDPQKAAKLEVLDGKIAAEDRLYRKAMLIGERHQVAAQQPSKADLEASFVKYVGGFIARNPHVSYAVWREMGVPPAILKQAGVEGVPGAVRAPGTPRRTRNNLTDPEFARALLVVARDEGGEAVAERFGYKRAYVPKLCRDLAERNPEVAAELGYDHEAVFPMGQPQRAAQKANKRARAS